MLWDEARERIWQMKNVTFYDMRTSHHYDNIDFPGYMLWLSGFSLCDSKYIP